jgi:Cu(I)/Ag(I) efflux system membrane fusion protein
MDRSEAGTRGGRTVEPTGDRKWRRMWVVTNWGTVLALVVACVCLGYVLRWATAPATTEPAPVSPATPPEAAATPAVWTCSMHPTVRQPAPGQCPICRMDLIRLEEDSAGASDPRLLALSENAKALMDVQTVPVER